MKAQEKKCQRTKRKVKNAQSKANKEQLLQREDERPSQKSTAADTPRSSTSHSALQQTKIHKTIEDQVKNGSEALGSQHYEAHVVFLQQPIMLSFLFPWMERFLEGVSSLF
jgi:hypothetical protein